MFERHLRLIQPAFLKASQQLLTTLFVINFALPDAGRKRGFIFFLYIWNLSDVSKQFGYILLIRPKFDDKRTTVVVVVAAAASAVAVVRR